jgi:hypothetical protein
MKQREGLMIFSDPNFSLRVTYVFCAALMPFFVTACSGNGSSDASTPATGASNLPVSTTTTPATSPTQAAYTPIIDNEDLSAGLKGIDANNNGIRDDIDRLIALRYAQTPAMKKAAEQEARALQKNIEATTKVQARIAGNEIRRAARCSYKSVPSTTDAEIKLLLTMSKEIEALTANTKERYIAYWNGEKLAGGMVFRQPEEPVCD